MKLSIIVPVYNEEKSILIILRKLFDLRLDIQKEIIIVNDGSLDESEAVIRKFIKGKKGFILINKQNEGKGSAVRRGICLAKGDIITIQDADLEYDPNEFKRLIIPIIEGKEKVVYGSRFLRKHKPKYKIYFLGNKFLSFLTKILYNSKITDMETCYKVFEKKTIKSLNLSSKKFDIEPEITSKLLRKGISIKELPISYTPRSIEEGKKIGWKDGIRAVLVLLRNRL